MKKAIAVLLSLMILLCVVSVFAEGQVQLGTSSLKLTFGAGYESDELTQEDIENDVVLYVIGDNMDCAVYQFASEGYSVADYVAEEIEEYKSNVLQSGTDAVINGIPAGYVVLSNSDASSQEDYTLEMDYVLADGDDLLIVAFFMVGDQSQAAAEIMNTLTK